MHSEPDQTIINAATRFADEVITPQAEQWNKQGQIPTETYQAAAELGLCRLIVPKQHGGLGLSVSAMAQVMQVLAGRCFATAFSLVVHNNLTARVALSARASVRDQLLPALMTGENLGAFLLTEPSVGSDATAIQTRADKCAQGWRLNGSKAWASNGGIANILSVYAQTDPGSGAKGIACFWVDANTSGVQREANYQLLGGHALATAGFEFSDVLVTDDALLVPAGEGFRVAMQGIDLARINVAAMCCGMMEQSLQLATKYVQTRPAFGRKVADFQGIQWMLADALTNLEAARLLTYEAARACDAGEATSVASAHAKKFATRAVLGCINDCMQVMGARGLSREHALPRHFAAAKMAQFLDGTTEIQNIVIARSFLKTKS
jgi:alkylation response protein AidB-like acyl-CoA dehydrogenase